MVIESFGTAPGRTVARLAKVLETALSRAELSLPQYRVLVYLSEGGAAASTLAGRLSVSRPSVTAIVDGLVQRGIVQRRPDPNDRRRIEHVLTSKGQRLLAKGDALIEERLRQLLDQLPTAEARAAIQGLGVLHRALNEARKHMLERK